MITRLPLRRLTLEGPLGFFLLGLGSDTTFSVLSEACSKPASALPRCVGMKAT